jgi:hypothetical protein
LGIVTQQGLSYLFSRIQIPYPKTLVIGASDEETNPSDESYTVNLIFMTLERHFNIRWFLSSQRFGRSFVRGGRHRLLFGVSVNRGVEKVAVNCLLFGE